MVAVTDVCIPAGQRAAHVAFEAAAVLTVAPFLIYAGTLDRPLTKTERTALVTIGLGTLAVDGYLLYRFVRTT